MVIVHLSDNQRRIITPQKNETLEDLFQRFCSQFGYERAQYEFQSYPREQYASLDMFMNASIVKEVVFVQKSSDWLVERADRLTRLADLRRGSADSCYTTIHEPPQTTDLPSAKSAAPARPAPIQSADASRSKARKRCAPKPPVAFEIVPTDSRSSTVRPDLSTPDIDIPPPPTFQPTSGNHADQLTSLPYRSVECETDAPSHRPPGPARGGQHCATAAADRSDDTDDESTASPANFQMTVPCASQETLESLDEHLGSANHTGSEERSSSSGSSVNDIYENERWARVTVEDDCDDEPGPREQSHPLIGRQEQCRPLIGREKQSSPVIGRQEQCRPVIGREHQCSPVIGRQEQCSPVIGREQQCSPVIGREEQCRPVIGRQEQCSPVIGREKQCSPVIGREEPSSPASTSPEPHWDMSPAGSEPDISERTCPVSAHPDDETAAAVVSGDSEPEYPPIVTERPHPPPPPVPAVQAAPAATAAAGTQASGAPGRDGDQGGRRPGLGESRARSQTMDASSSSAARAGDRGGRLQTGLPPGHNYWDSSKQSKTLQLLARVMHTTMDNYESSEAPAGPAGSGDGGRGSPGQEGAHHDRSGSLPGAPPPVAPPPAAAATIPPAAVPEPVPRPVRVVVREIPLEEPGRLVYRPRQAKSLFFTAEPKLP